MVQWLLGASALALALVPAASRPLAAIRVADGGDLQGAINAARPGDTILLSPGARFVGNFVLPAIEDAQAFITIRTDGSELPGEGTRTGPHVSGRLAILQSPNGDPALRTAPAAHHWRLENVEFRANRDGYNDIIALGSGTQREHREVPHTIVLDRLLITGHPDAGQKRAIALNSGRTEIRNCYIAGVRGVGMDTQAIGSWNGPGPYVIENNYLEAAGENIMFGGSDSAIAGLVPDGIVIRRNQLAKPASWRDPIVIAPTGLTVRRSTRPGSLPEGTYTYSVVSEKPAGQGTTAVSTAGAPVTGRVAGAAELAWEPVEGASAYRVYRSGAGGWVHYRTSSTHLIDTGAPGAGGAPPARATVWSVKNLFELKNARNVLFEGNVLERNWTAAQPGYAILLQPINQDGRAPWVTLERIRIVNNIVRDVSSAIHIVGTDQRHPSGRARGIAIENNLFANIDKAAWGGAGDFLLIGGGPADVRIEQNTAFNSGRAIAAFGSTRPPAYVEGFVFRNNVLRHNEYGVKGDGVSTGQATLERYFPGAVFEGNVLAGGRPALYPRRNYFPPLDRFEALFVRPDAGDFRLRPDCPCRDGVTGGRGAGVDLDALERALGR